MANAPFPIDPVLVGVTKLYKNERFIADEVSPRIPVGKKEFKYWEFPLAQSFTIPETRVGRKSKPNEVDFQATEKTDSTEDYGLDDPIPQDDIDNAPENFDPKAFATQTVTDLILLDREKRVADMTFNPNNYGASNKTTLAGADQWSDPTSDPVKAIQDAIDTCIMRPNVLIVGQRVWTNLSRHPKIIEAIFWQGANTGKVTRQQLAALLEIEDIIVGQAWYNSAKKGQNTNIVRLWGNHAALHYRNRLANTQGGITFTYTAQFQTRQAGARPDPDIGVRGGQRVRVWESVKEVIVANDVGYLFTNAVA